MIFKILRNNIIAAPVSAAIIVSYLSIFVIHASFVYFIFYSLIRDVRAEEADEIFNRMKSQYQIDAVTDSVASEDLLSTINNKYKNTDNDQPDASISEKINDYNNRSAESESIDLTLYQSTQSFDSRYNSAYPEGVGGLGMPKQPAVTGSSVTTNYSATGATATKDSSGNYSFTAPTDKIGTSKLVKSEQDANLNVNLETVDCSFLPRPKICDLK